MRSKQTVITEGKEPFQVEATVLTVGDDLLVTVCGGEKPHIGAVAVSLPRPSLRDERRISSTTSVYTLQGHKEDELAKQMAQEIAAALNRNTVLTVGIHVEDITGEGIEEIKNSCMKIKERLLAIYKK